MSRDILCQFGTIRPMPRPKEKEPSAVELFYQKLWEERGLSSLKELADQMGISHGALRKAGQRNSLSPHLRDLLIKGGAQLEQTLVGVGFPENAASDKMIVLRSAVPNLDEEDAMAVVRLARSLSKKTPAS